MWNACLAQKEDSFEKWNLANSLPIYVNHLYPAAVDVILKVNKIKLHFKFAIKNNVMLIPQKSNATY